MADSISKGSQHRMMVDCLLEALESPENPSWELLLERLAKVVPDSKAEHLQAAWEDAHGIWQERIEMQQAELEAHNLIGTLFEGLPDDTVLEDAVRIRAAEGNEFALYLQANPHLLEFEIEIEGDANG